MKISVNGETKEVDDSLSLATLLKELLNEQTLGIAVALNYDVITKDEWAMTTLQESDQIEIVRATQGG